MKKIRILQIDREIQKLKDDIQYHQGMLADFSDDAASVEYHERMIADCDFDIGELEQEKMELDGGETMKYLLAENNGKGLFFWPSNNRKFVVATIEDNNGIGAPVNSWIHATYYETLQEAYAAMGKRNG